MAQAAIQLDREAFSCVICLDLLKDPVALSCGHNYCLNCVQTHWDREEQQQLYSCPHCRQRFAPRPVLVKNTMLADLVEQLKNCGLQAPVDLCPVGPGDVACDVCSGRKLKAVKSCLQCLVSYCETHLQPHFQSAAFRKHQLVAPSEKLQENICSEHNEVKKMFCHSDQQLLCVACCMEQLRSQHTLSVAAERAQKQTELETRRDQLLQTVQDKETEGLDNTSLDLREDQHLLPRPEGLLPQPEPITREDFLKYSREITLDPNTAHRQLLLSECNRRITYFDKNQRYRNHTDRFSHKEQVLSRESLTGRCYWEVEWKGPSICIAASYKNIKRKGDTTECMFGSHRSWALYCIVKMYCFYSNNVYSKVSGPFSSRIGVYLDHDAGVLSFYSIEDQTMMTLLHRVQTTFTQPLYAGLAFKISYNGNTAHFPKLK